MVIRPHHTANLGTSTFQGAEECERWYLARLSIPITRFTGHS